MKIKYLDPDWPMARYGLFAEGDGEGAGGGSGGAAAEGAGAGAAAAGAGNGEGAGAGAGAGGQGAGGDGGQGADPGKASGAADWRAGITNPDARKLADDSTDINHLAERALTMRQKLANAVVLPGKDAKPEEITAYRQKIGVPENPEGYIWEDAEGYEPTEADKAMRGTMAKAFHDHNIPAETAKAITATYREMMVAQAQAIQDADKRYAEETEAALKREWGADYDQNTVYAERAAKEVFGDQVNEARNIEGKDGRFVLDHPILRKALAKIGREMGEDRIGSVISDSDRSSISDQVASLRTQATEAQAKGDSRKANELYQQEQALLAKLNGNQPVVGARGRAA